MNFEPWVSAKLLIIYVALIELNRKVTGYFWIEIDEDLK